MRHLTSLQLVATLALGSLVACGGSDANTPAQAPTESQTTTTSAPSYAGPNGPDTTGPASPTPTAMTGSAPGDGINTSGQAMPSGQGATYPSGAPLATMGSSQDTSGSASAGSTATSDATLTDAQISGVLDAANRGEIEQAKLVVKKTKNASVKQFANQMITAHQSAENNLSTVDTKASVTPQDSPKSDQVKSAGAQVMSSLQSASASDLDKTYIDAQVDQHQKVLGLIDQSLAQAKSDDLKKYLRDTRRVVAQHLAHAQEIQSSLSK